MGMGSSATSSRNKVPPCAAWKSPGWSATAPVKLPFLCPKNSLSKILRDGAAVDGDERLAGPGPLIVDVAGHQLLAGPRLAGDVDRRLAAGELRDSRADHPHGLGIADQPGLRLGAALRDTQGLADHDPEPAEVDRLGNEVEGTRLVAYAERIYNPPLEHLG